MNLSLGSLNKKTLIQIVVLLLVIVVGAGFYFRTQGGPGLDFLTGLFGKEAPKAPAPPPTPVPAPKPPEPEYPAHAPKGQLLGKAFVADSIVFEEGALVLRQGTAETSMQELRVYLPGNKWETPTDKKFKFENAAGADIPRVHVSTKEAGQTDVARQEFSEKYSLKLEFGPEKDKKLPGKFKLTLPDDGKSMVAGSFEADIRGFRIVNGKPDLAADSVDTLEYLALHEVLKDDPDKTVKDVDLRDGHYVLPGDADKPKTGYLEAAYQVGDGTPVVQRFQFVKDKGEWRVLRVLGANQIVEAHPHDVPTANSAPDKQMIYQAAVRLEKDAAKKHPAKGIYGVEFTAMHNDKNRLGVCQVSYRPLPTEEPVKKSYLFRQKKGSWVLERELAKTETVDIEKGVIRKQPTAAKPKASVKKTKPKTATKR